MNSSGLLPNEITWWDPVAVTLAVAGTMLWVRWLASRLLNDLDATSFRRVTLGAALVMLITLAVGWTTVTYPALWSVVAPDGAQYQRLIDGISSELPGVARPPQLPDRAVFLYLIAMAQWLFGAHAYVTVVVNAGLAATSYLLLVHMTHRLVRGTGLHPRTTQLTALLYLAVPIVHVWMASPLREALVLALLLTSLDASIRVAQGDDPAWLLASVGAAAVLGGVRGVAVPAALGGLAAAAAIRSLQQPRLRAFLFAPGTLAIGSVISLVAFWSQRGSLGLLAREAVTRARTHFVALGDGGTALPRPEPNASLIEVLLLLPRDTVRYLVGPLDPAMLAARPQFLVDVPVWVALTPALLLGMWVLLVRTAQPDRAAVVLLLAVAPTLVIGALSLGNYGIISRIRLVTWLPLLPIIAAGTQEMVARRERNSLSHAQPSST